MQMLVPHLWQVERTYPCCVEGNSGQPSAHGPAGKSAASCSVCASASVVLCTEDQSMASRGYLDCLCIVDRRSVLLAVEVAEAPHLAGMLDVGVPLLAVLVPADAPEEGGLAGLLVQPCQALSAQLAGCEVRLQGRRSHQNRRDPASETRSAHVRHAEYLLPAEVPCAKNAVRLGPSMHVWCACCSGACQFVDDVAV